MQQPLILKQQTKALIRNYLQLRIPYAECVQAFKKEFIVLVLVAHRGNQCRAARALGMHRNTLGRTLAEFKIDAQLIRSLGKQLATGLRSKSRKTSLGVAGKAGLNSILPSTAVASVGIQSQPPQGKATYGQPARVTANTRDTPGRV